MNTPHEVTIKAWDDQSDGSTKIRYTSRLVTCNQCTDQPRCDAEGCCMALVEQERCKNRLAMDQLTPGERFALMLAGKVVKPKESDETK